MDSGTGTHGDRLLYQRDTTLEENRSVETVLRRGTGNPKLFVVSLTRKLQMVNVVAAVYGLMPAPLNC